MKPDCQWLKGKLSQREANRQAESQSLTKAIELIKAWEVPTGDSKLPQIWSSTPGVLPCIPPCRARQRTKRPSEAESDISTELQKHAVEVKKGRGCKSLQPLATAAQMATDCRIFFVTGIGNL